MPLLKTDAAVKKNVKKTVSSTTLYNRLKQIRETYAKEVVNGGDISTTSAAKIDIATGADNNIICGAIYGLLSVNTGAKSSIRRANYPAEILGYASMDASANAESRHKLQKLFSFLLNILSVIRTNDEDAGLELLNSLYTTLGMVKKSENSIANTTNMINTVLRHLLEHPKILKRALFDMRVTTIDELKLDPSTSKLAVRRNQFDNLDSTLQSTGYHYRKNKRI